MAYRVGIDSGGTFTDLVALSEEGTMWIYKVPSDPSDPARVLRDGLAGLAQATGATFESFLSDCDVIIHGSTVAVNILIQHNGAKTGLLTTQGHEDSIEIRLGHKEDGHRWDFAFPPAVPLVPAYLRCPVHERVLADGTVYQPLDEAQALESIQILRSFGVEAVAISCLWSFLHPKHEERLVELVRQELPDSFISASSRVLPRVREYTRTSTTVTNAYIGPALERYMAEIENGLAEHGFTGNLYYMQSNGGMGTRAILRERPVAALNSGPAAGPIAALHFATLLDHRDVISVDMGGTSFDTSVVKDGLPDIVTDIDIVRYRIGLPMVNVTSIGAGGGSIAKVDARGILQVGPESAEARPGPACYGLGGEKPTVTDALVTLGYLPTDALLGGRMPIRKDLSLEAIERHVADPLGISIEDAARGIVHLTTNNMVDGIRIASIERGYDPRDFVLMAGGGAGPTFAGLLASELGIETVVVPKVAGGLCAFGEAVADLRYDTVRSYPTTLGDIDLARLNRLFDEMESEGRAALPDALTDTAVVSERTAEMKYVDQVHYCDVRVPDGELDSGALGTLRANFDARHEQLYTYCEPENEAEILTLRSSVSVPRPLPPPESSGSVPSTASPGPTGARSVYLPTDVRPVDVPVYEGDGLPAQAKIVGPAIIEEPTTTIVVFPGSKIVVDPRDFYEMTVTQVTWA